MSNFWQKLPRPFTVLAPMDDVTDNVFRQVVLQAGRPDVFFTEFASADGLVHGGHGIPLRKLNFTPDQHPIVAQIWGADPEKFEKAAGIVKDLGFDGIDINMGCPVRDVVKSGAGAGLIGSYEKAEMIIEAVKKGSGGLPLSIKTRLGIKENIARDWTTFLLKHDLAALIIHARLAKQMSTGFADWEEIGKIVKLRDAISPKTPIIGNGDVKSYAEVVEKQKKYGVDGVMIGRGIFANPWIFNKGSEPVVRDLESGIKGSEPMEHPKGDYIKLFRSHIYLFEKTWGETKNFDVIKKFVKMYIKDFDGANELRKNIMETKNFTEMRKVLVIE